MKQSSKFKVQNSKSIEEEIINSLKYFSFFNYSPTLAEIHTFLKKKISERAVARILQQLANKSIILVNFKVQSSNSKQTAITSPKISNIRHLISNPDKLIRYTLPEYPMNVQTFAERQKISLDKIKKIQPYVRILSLFWQIRLIGLSGSVAMLSAEEEHDVDLFIITAKNRIFTGRFIALLLAELMGVRRSFQKKRGSNRQKIGQIGNIRSSQSPDLRVSDISDSSSLRYSEKDKVCLNLFFDESDLRVPNFKKSEYVAHEILQMKPFDFSQGKPFVQKGDIYSRFIDANKWVFDIFPNARRDYHGLKKDFHGNQRKSVFFSLWRSLALILEQVLKSLQLHFINKHKTTEIITGTQLWFHPDDFERKINGKGS